MKAVLISIKPEWCELIATGKKIIEIRKRRPKMIPPFKCYIYMTSGDASIPDGKGMFHHHSGGRCVIGEFVCDKIIPIKVFPNGTIQNYMFYNMEQSCVDYDDIVNYIGNGCDGYGWHISNVVIYDKLMLINEFIKPCERDLLCEECSMYSELAERCCSAKLRILRPPQSWCYVEEVT